MPPRTDIICLVHNALDVTKGFIDHLEANTPPRSYSLIFVNNGSDAETTEFLSSGNLERWDVVHSPENLGVIGGRNLGVRYVKNSYFLNIDNDQYVKKGWLEGLHELMQSGYDIVGSEAWSLVPPKASGKVIMHGREMNRGYFPFKHCKDRGEKFTYIGCGGMLIKKDVFDTIGLFDERFSPAYFEDPDFCFRAIKAGFKLGWKHDCPIDHLEHQTIGRQKQFDKGKQFVRSWTAFQKKWHPYFPEPIQMERL